MEAQPKTAAELANLKILFHRTPEGVGASGDIRGKFQYEIVPLPRHMYQNQYRHDQKKRKMRGGSSSASSSSHGSISAKPPTAMAPVKSSTGARPNKPYFKIPKFKAVKAKTPTSQGSWL